MLAAWSSRWKRWIDSRSPRQNQLTLTQRNVYILPAKGGWVYAAVVGVLLVAAINEQLNLAYALAFLLGGVGLSAMWLTHSNLRGLSLTLGPCLSVHAGQALQAQVLLDAQSHRRGRYGLTLHGQVPCEVGPGQQAVVHVSVPTTQRGWMLLPRWRVDSTYPLGLFRAWAYWRAAPAVLIWPALEPQAPPLPDGLGGDGDRPTSAQHLAAPLPEEVREWQRGDALRTIAWKKSATRLASGQNPISRYHPAQARQTLWIDWDDAAGLPAEARLSRLAAWLVMAEQQALHGGQAYGLTLPGMRLECAHGQAHLHRCLDALAQWGQVGGHEVGP